MTDTVEEKVVGEASPADIAKEAAATQDPITKEEPVEEPAPKEEPKKEEDKSKVKEEEPAKTEDKEPYIEMSDPIGKVIIETLEAGGITAKESDDIFGEAIDTLDLSKIKRDVLVERLGEDKAAHVMAYARDYYERNLANIRTTVEAIDTILGGKSSREVIMKWANKQASVDSDVSKEVKEIFNTLEKQDPFTAKLATTRLKELYLADPKTTVKPNMHKGDQGVKEVATYITRGDYITQLKAAHDSRNMEEVARLDSMRRYSMKVEASRK